MLKMLRKTILLLSVLLGSAITLAYSQDAQEDNKVKAREYYLKGNLLYQQGQYKEAQEEFRKALDLLNHTKETPVVQPEEKKREEVKETMVFPLPPAKGEKQYIIGEEDELHISVWQNPDLDADVTVRPDGKISVPLIDEVQAGGLTIPQLDYMMTEKLKEFVKHPQVSISIKKMGGQKVIVLGEVMKPGVYSVTGARTVIEAITLAGGMTKDAIASSVVIVRGGFEKPQARRISLNKALKGDIRQNPPLNSQDIVFVPKKFIADLNYVLNQILEPLSKGAYVYKEWQTLNAATITKTSD